MRLDPQRLKKIQIIHEDDELLAIDKPTGLASQPGADDKRSVLEILESAYDAPISLHLCHRLDRGTSGVLLLAKDAKTAGLVAKRWDDTRKIYVAASLGAWSGPKRIVTPLETERGLVEAETLVLRVKVIDHELGPLSLLVLELGTGRTHQIRKHLSGLGHPILLDDRHGQFGANKTLTRWLKASGSVTKGQLFLHAFRLRLTHPSRGMPLAFEAPPPEVFQTLLGKTEGALGDLLLDIP